MLNPERRGYRYPSYRYEVGREKVRDYAVATGHGEAYLGDEEGLIAPPLFAACMASKAGRIVMDDRELGAHWNLVHGGQGYTFHRPIRVGDVLTCTPAITDISAREAMEFLTIAVACADADTGEAVLDARTALILFSQEAR